MRNLLLTRWIPLAAGFISLCGLACAAEPASTLDIARFARIVTWDPDRTDGARAGRIEEFRAEDLFLNPMCRSQRWHLPRARKHQRPGLHRAAVAQPPRVEGSGPGIPDSAPVPPTNSVQVQGWFGESAWQGSWKPLVGRDAGCRQPPGLSPLARSRCGADAEDSLGLSGQRASLVAVCLPSPRSRWQTVNLRVEAEKPARGARGEITICNGELLPVAAAQGLLDAEPGRSSGMRTRLKARSA